MNIDNTKLEYLTKDLGEFEIVGSGPEYVSSISSISEGGPNSLTWLNPNHTEKSRLIESCNAGFIVMHKSEEFTPGKRQVFIKVSNPKLFYVKILRRIVDVNERGLIHPTAVVSPQSKIHPSVNIGPFCVVGNCVIGKNTTIDSHCVLGDNIQIGENCKLASGVVIGSDGFGYVEDDDGSKIKFPHIGGVIIGNNVEIGSNTCIDRGTLGNTIINDGVKIDNLVHIAHNVTIGKNSFIIANAMIGGSTEIGENTWIAPSVTLKDALRVGSFSIVGLGALVTKNVPDKEVWAGFPAKHIRNNI